MYFICVTSTLQNHYEQYTSLLLLGKNDILRNTYGLIQILQIAHFVFNNKCTLINKYYLAILCTIYFKAIVGNVGELARFESGTSSKLRPLLSVLRPKLRPHKHERASTVGVSCRSQESRVFLSCWNKYFETINAFPLPFQHKQAITFLTSLHTKWIMTMNVV